MIISINGIDNSEKTTQVKKLMQDYPKIFTSKLHISVVSAFNKEN